jgi:hypothetical protein
MSEFDNENDMEATNAPIASSESVKPTILFTNAEQSHDETGSQGPTVESSPTNTVSSSSSWSIWWSVIFIMSIFGAAATFQLMLSMVLSKNAFN